MCDSCFTRELKTFPNKYSWDKFDLELIEKVSKGRLKEFEFIRDSWRDKDDGYFQYQCQACGQKWIMKDPDRPWNTTGFHGYLLKTSRLRTNETPGTGVIKAVLFVLALVIVRIVYYIFFE